MSENDRSELTPGTAVHRVGGGAVENLRLKPREELLVPPGTRAVAGLPGYRQAEDLIMSFQCQQVVSLCDGQGRDLGRVVVERIEGDLVFGRFTPGPHYPAVARLFAEFVEAANEQLLSLVGELDATIRALGLRLTAPGHSSRPAIDDVQIGDGVITFRIQPRPDDGPLTSPAAAPYPPPAPARPDVPTA